MRILVPSIVAREGSYSAVRDVIAAGRPGLARDPAVVRGDFVANGAMFTAYHLHQPWSMPATLLDGIFSQAYPARWFQSIWIGIITHTVPSFAIIGFLLYLVVK